MKSTREKLRVWVPVVVLGVLGVAVWVVPRMGVVGGGVAEQGWVEDAAGGVERVGLGSGLGGERRVRGEASARISGLGVVDAGLEGGEGLEAVEGLDQGGSVVVAIVDGDGVRPEQGGVEVWAVGARRSGAEQRVAFAWEEARFEGLVPGRYWVAVVARSLSEGWVPAHPEGWHVDFAEPPAEEIEVGAGEQVEVSLLVRRSARVYGRVLGPGGQGVPYATVRFQATGKFVGRGHTVEVDAEVDGRYGVDLTPGRFLITVLPGPNARGARSLDPDLPLTEESPILGLTKPLPRFRSVSQGETLRHDIHFGQGSAVIRGRVVDEAGEPMAGLRTIVYPVEGPDGPIGMGWASAVAGVDTDDHGRFEFRGLDAARYGVQTGVSGAYTPRAPVGSNRLGDWAEAVYVDVAEGQVLDVGEVRVWRSRPFVVRGRVHSASGRQYLWSVVEPAGFRRRPMDLEMPVRVSWEGDFQWHVETPEGPLLFRGRDGERIVWEESFAPLPDVELWQEIRVP